MVHTDEFRNYSERLGKSDFPDFHQIVNTLVEPNRQIKILRVLQ
jgi:hypothetical protein